jgi:hypothetical protein
LCRLRMSLTRSLYNCDAESPLSLLKASFHQTEEWFAIFGNFLIAFSGIFERKSPAGTKILLRIKS